LKDSQIIPNYLKYHFLAMKRLLSSNSGCRTPLLLIFELSYHVNLYIMQKIHSSSDVPAAVFYTQAQLQSPEEYLKFKRRPLFETSPSGELL
jgi:hypothetical protein